MRRKGGDGNFHLELAERPSDQDGLAVGHEHARIIAVGPQRRMKAIHRPLPAQDAAIPTISSMATQAPLQNLQPGR
jgi:hypothetical protein